MEAARMRGAVLHGPHVEANRTTANALATTTPPAALCIRDAASLADGVGRLLGDEWLLEASRRAAADAAGRLGRGVLANILPLIREALRLERGEWRALAAGGGR
jgi:3-deoxy-D-manno-octulosonic-acid transferase